VALGFGIAMINISWHLNDVNTKLQLQQTFVSDVYWAIKGFQNEAETIFGTAGKC
jgi:hypothetical protein